MRAGERGRRAGWLVALAWLVVAVRAEAGRPLMVDDAEPVDAGRVQVEAGLELTRAPDSTTLAVPLGLTVGLAEWLEVGVAPAALYVANDSMSPRQAVGVGDLLLEAKLALPFAPFGLALALAPSLKIPTADARRDLGTGALDGGLLLIVSHGFTDDVKLHLNLGYTFVGRVRGQELRDVLFVGAAVETGLPAGLPRDLRLVAEVFGTSQREAGGHPDVQARLGLQYLLREDLVLDAGVGRSLTSPRDADVFATIGVTWTFDGPWSPEGPPTRGTESAWSRSTCVTRNGGKSPSLREAQPPGQIASCTRRRSE